MEKGESNLGKSENNGYKYFFLFVDCFQKAF